MKPLHIVIGVVAALALAGGGFAAGMTVARVSTSDAAASPSPSGAAGRGAGAGIGAGAGRLGQGGAPVAAGGQAMTGRILSVNDGSITVEVRQAGAAGASPTVTSQIVLVGSSTRLVKTAETEIKLTDLKANALQGILGGGRNPTGGQGASPSPSARP